MKKLILLFSAAIMYTNGAQSQITNSGFENWTAVGAYQNPTGWATMNGGNPGPLYSCTKSTDHYPANVGSFSIRLENIPVLTQTTGAYGMAITKSFDYPFKPAFPVIGHPNSLTGYFKYTSVNNDTAFIKVNLFLNGVLLNPGSLIGDAFVVLATVPAWTSFSLNLPAYTTADSASVWLSAMYPSTQLDGPNGSSVLYVDNLNWDNLIVTDVNEQGWDKTSFKLFPNPATDVIELQSANSNQEALTLNIYSIFGQLIRSEKLEIGQNKVSVANLYNGIYFVELQSKEGTQKQKLIIQK